MRPSRRFKGKAPALDLTPLVDVVFLLVIFFMVTTTFVSSEVSSERGLEVELPSAETGSAGPAGAPSVTLTSDGLLYLGETQIEEAQLVELLRARLAAASSATVTLRADASVPHGSAVRLMDLIRAAGASQIAIATD
jgi:biopolymer transport protein ExbD